MNKQTAFKCIQQYVTGWKKNNIQLIISCLTPDCVVIESHGPIYHGIHDMELWFKYWMKANSSISKWEILSYYFCETENTAFFEWDFACNSSGQEFFFQGMSIIKFVNEKISYLHEYRMTNPAYAWKGNQLMSE